MEQELKALVQKYGFHEVQAQMNEWASTCHISEEMQRRERALDAAWKALPRFAPGYDSFGKIEGRDPGCPPKK